MVEVYLFIVVGAVAIIAAALMLLSENAVHSAMFLILNFACVAFLYLMLNAPFLAMVQLAVYAGAIMVLFLFVIMLLGAEQAETPISPMSNEPGSRFHTWVALGLALVMLLAVAVGIGRGDVDTLENNGPPMLRVVHAASLTEFVDVTLDGEVLKNDVAFRETTGFTEIEAGTHIIEVLDTDTEEVVWSGEVEVEAPAYPGAVNTVVVYGLEEAEVFTFIEDFSAPPEREARITVFNAFSEPVAFQDAGVFGRDGDARVLAAEIFPGEVSDPALIAAGEYDSLRLVRPDAAEDDSESVNELFAMRDRDFSRNSNTLIVIAEQPNSLLPNVTILAETTLMPFGSPQAIGQALFTTYVLPLQVVGLLLLAALVGVIIIAQRQVSAVGQASGTRRPLRRRVSRPLVSVVASQVQSEDGDSPALSSGEQPAGD